MNNFLGEGQVSSLGDAACGAEGRGCYAVAAVVSDVLERLLRFLGIPPGFELSVPANVRQGGNA